MQPYRIIPGTISNEFWIVGQAKGLGLLVEDQQGAWSFTQYPIGSVWDAVGPDNNGRIWCSSFVTGIGTAIQVFNCNTKDVIQNVNIGPDYVTTGITLSINEDYVYLLGWDWPRFGEPGSWVSSFGHPNAGIVWEINISSFEVSPDIGVVGVFPYTIYYAGSQETDKLLVYTLARDDVGREGGECIDILAVDRSFPRLGGLPACFTNEYLYCNDLVKWSDEDPLIALCNRSVDNMGDSEDFSDGLWIIDTELEEVVQTYRIYDIADRIRGVQHLCVSEVRPGIAYMSLGFGGLDAETAVFDMATGQVIEHIQTGLVFTPEFIYELPDGRLIVTGGRTKNIVIIDPLH